MFNRKRRLISRNSRNLPPRRLPLMYSRTKKILSLVALLTFAISLIYLIFFSGYLTTREIKVINDRLENESVVSNMEKSLDQFLGKNLLFLDLNDISTTINTAFPQLENIEINKNYPSTLEVEFKEYPLTANIINESNTLKKTFIVNSIGFATKEDYEDPSLPYIRIQSDEPLNPQSIIINPKTLEYISKTVAYFEEKFGMRVVETLYKPVPREIHLLTEKDFYIWLDIQRPSEDQLKKLKKALVKLDIYNENLEYIDLRISGSNGDKIIYKRK